MLTTKDRTQLVLDAQRKGFQVVENEGNTGWLVHVPAKPRVPANAQGEFKTSDRAWSMAALLALEYPELK